MIRRIALPCILALTSACAVSPRRPADASDYVNDLVFPAQTEQLVMVERFVYDSPLLGVKLGYRRKDPRGDLVDVFIYPIRASRWSEEDAALVLDTAIRGVLEEIEVASRIEGGYELLGEARIEPYRLQSGGAVYEGRHLVVPARFSDGYEYDSHVFLFLQGDKYVKFRCRIPRSEFTRGVAPDYAVREILPALRVPPPSPWMQRLRTAFDGILAPGAVPSSPKEKKFSELFRTHYAGMDFPRVTYHVDLRHIESAGNPEVGVLLHYQPLDGRGDWVFVHVYAVSAEQRANDADRLLDGEIANIVDIARAVTEGASRVEWLAEPRIEPYRMELAGVVYEGRRIFIPFREGADRYDANGYLFVKAGWFVYIKCLMHQSSVSRLADEDYAVRELLPLLRPPTTERTSAAQDPVPAGAD
ncbi:MAG: hypothetical protein KatS3mg121_0703 [Gammaproteobacteria bacterium]|nr:MAG: hypothetical protein KatS3mg121_0703 [Gammaproteobacteria bacterium]